MTRLFNDTTKKISDFFDKVSNGVIPSVATLGFSNFELATINSTNQVFSYDMSDCGGGCSGTCYGCSDGCQGGCTGCESCYGGCQGYCTGAA